MGKEDQLRTFREMRAAGAERAASNSGESPKVRVRKDVGIAPGPRAPTSKPAAPIKKSKYRDPEKRKAYMRELMRKRRARERNGE